ncbi:MAG: 3-methyl-2-oxobutanoate hydroxymethyltransferase [Chloroflexota bacterium]
MSPVKRVTVTDIQAMRERDEKITMLTAYDYSTARIADEAGIPVLLVGDSLGMVVLGYESTLPVTVDDMIRHGAAVVRGTDHAHVVVDMPFGSYQGGWQDAMKNAVRIMQETGAGSVKLEGGERSAEIVRHLVAAGIPVMGHIGLTPQSVNAFGGWRMQGKVPRDRVRLMADAKALEDAGAYAVVLETVPAEMGAKITQQLRVPTIGIGAGPYTSGQVQVVHDLLGLFQDFKPKHARRFLDGAELIRAAFEEYRDEVVSGAFPTAAESFGLDDAMRERIEGMTIQRADEPAPMPPRGTRPVGNSDIGDEGGYAPDPVRTDIERHGSAAKE